MCTQTATQLFVIDIECKWQLLFLSWNHKERWSEIQEFNQSKDDLKFFGEEISPKPCGHHKATLKNLVGSKQDVVRAHQTNYYTDSLTQPRSEGLRSSKSRRGDFNNREKIALFLRRSRNATSEKETSSSNKSHPWRERTKKTYGLKNRIEEQLKLLGTGILWKIQRWT
jgi:hypothetical protein